MRRRLTLTMVLMVFGTLVLSGLATLALAVHQSRVTTQHELVREAQGLAVSVRAESADKADPARALRNLLVLMSGPLRLQGSAVVLVDPASGQLRSPAQPGRSAALPKGLRKSDLRPPALLAGSTVSGITGGGLVYAAAPYTAVLQIPGQGAEQTTQAVVLTRSPPTGLATAGLWFAVSAVVILAVAALVANRLGGRVAEPLEAARQVTERIAAGDLEAQVPVPPGADAELASLARSINQMASRLARAQGAERQFLLAVSHELRTPLTSIRGFAEAIEDGMATDAPAAARVIASESRRLERLVADLLALAALEARRFTLRMERIDLMEVVEATSAGFLPSAAELGLTLSIPPGSGPGIPVVSDPDRLAQVIANLIENALRFARQHVRVGATAQDGKAQLWVEDDGPGIAPDDLPRVFSRLFASGPRAGRPITSGLGLAIVAELVEAMHGTVRAESPLGPGGGTRLVVTLPA